MMYFLNGERASVQRVVQSAVLTEGVTDDQPNRLATTRASKSDAVLSPARKAYRCDSIRCRMNQPFEWPLTRFGSRGLRQK